MTRRLPLALAALLLLLAPAFAWWNSSWMYRRAATISNDTGSTLTDFQVRITVDTASLISAGKMNSDCSDLRFVDSDDVTELNYWIESGCDTNSTVVWVKVPSIPAGGTTIYMYYGNPTATSESNAQATFDFYDDFESGTLGSWWTVEAGTWDVTTCPTGGEGTYCLHSLDAAASSFISATSATITTNIVIEYTWYRATQGTYDDFGIQWNAPDNSEIFQARLGASTDAYYFGVYYGATWYRAVGTYAYVTGNWYKAVLVVGTQDMNAYLYDSSGTLLETLNAPASVSSFVNTPYLRFYNYINQDAYIDYVIMRKWANPEPTATVSTTEEMSGTGASVSITHNPTDQPSLALDPENNITEVNVTWTASVAYQQTIPLELNIQGYTVRPSIFDLTFDTNESQSQLTFYGGASLAEDNGSTVLYSDGADGSWAELNGPQGAFGNTSFTVSLWIYIAPDDPTARWMAVSTGCAGAPNVWYVYGDESTGESNTTLDVGFVVYSDDAGRLAAAAYDLPNIRGAWHSIVGVFDAEAHEVRLYFDGNLIATYGGWSKTIDFNVSKITLMRYPCGGGYYMKGYVDRVAVWLGALDKEYNITELTGTWHGDNITFSHLPPPVVSPTPLREFNVVESYDAVGDYNFCVSARELGPDGEYNASDCDTVHIDMYPQALDFDWNQHIPFPNEAIEFNGTAQDNGTLTFSWDALGFTGGGDNITILLSGAYIVSSPSGTLSQGAYCPIEVYPSVGYYAVGVSDVNVFASINPSSTATITVSVKDLETGTVCFSTAKTYTNGTTSVISTYIDIPVTNCNKSNKLLLEVSISNGGIYCEPSTIATPTAYDVVYVDGKLGGSVTVTYSILPSTYPVTMTVTDDVGLSKSISKDVPVYAVPRILSAREETTLSLEVVPDSRLTASATWHFPDANITVSGNPAVIHLSEEHTPTGTVEYNLSDGTNIRTLEDNVPIVNITYNITTGFRTALGDSATLETNGFNTTPTCTAKLNGVDANLANIVFADGDNVVEVNCVGNTKQATLIDNKYMVVKNLSLIDERTKQDTNLAALSSCVIKDIDAGTQYDLKANNRTQIYYENTADAHLRLEFTIPTIEDIIGRDLYTEYLKAQDTICAGDATQYQIIVSSVEKPVVMRSVYAGCLVLADTTHYAYTTGLMAKAYTTDALYYLYTYDGNALVLLATIDGSLANTVNLDALKYTKASINIAITSDAVSIDKVDENTVRISYLNLQKNNSYVVLRIYDNTTTYVEHLETESPNDFTVYITTAEVPAKGLLTLEIEAHRTNGDVAYIRRLFTMEGASGTIAPEVAIVLAILILLFTLTAFAVKWAFGPFGLLGTVAALLILANAPQVPSVLFMEAVSVLLLMYIIITYRAEGATIT